MNEMSWSFNSLIMTLMLMLIFFSMNYKIFNITKFKLEKKILYFKMVK